MFDKDLASFLVGCARLHGDDTFYETLRRRATGLLDRPELPLLAERHGLGPLLYHHLRAANIPLPATLKEKLQGLYLRHRHANRVRLAVLTDSLAALQQASIRTVLLKGAALAPLIYPEPGLRPMRDLDLLVAPSQARRAQDILRDLGFEGPAITRQRLPDKHLPALGLHSDGFWINVEIHHNLYNQKGRHSDHSFMLDDSTPLRPVSLNDLTAHTLSYEETLGHLCRHVAYHANLWEILRFIWIADIVGLAEQCVEQIDWSYIRRHDPLVLTTLALCHFATPLSPTLLQHVSLPVERVPGGVGHNFAGWPQTSLVHLRSQGVGRLLRETFFPAEWWLRLHYQLGPTTPLFWYRWLRHPLAILGGVKQYVTEQLSWRLSR